MEVSGKFTIEKLHSDRCRLHFSIHIIFFQLFVFELFQWSRKFLLATRLSLFYVKWLIVRLSKTYRHEIKHKKKPRTLWTYKKLFCRCFLRKFSRSTENHPTWLAFFSLCVGTIYWLRITQWSESSEKRVKINFLRSPSISLCCASSARDDRREALYGKLWNASGVRESKNIFVRDECGAVELMSCWRFGAEWSSISSRFNAFRNLIMRKYIYVFISSLLSFVSVLQLQSHETWTTVRDSIELIK